MYNIFIYYGRMQRAITTVSWKRCITLKKMLIPVVIGAHHNLPLVGADEVGQASTMFVFICHHRSSLQL